MNVTSITNCARCGKNHGPLKMKKFRRPPPRAVFSANDTNTTYTHWAMCPVTKDPILQVVIK